MQKKYLYVILVVFIFIACQRPANKLIIGSNDEVAPSLLIDSFLIKVDKRYKHNIIKYTYYNSEDTTRIDSIKLYYADTKTLESIEYRPGLGTRDNKWISLIRYNKSGKKESLLYDYNNPKKGDTIKIFWHPDGVILSVMIYAKDSTNSTVIYEEFHSSGILKERGILDEIGYRRAPSGLWQYYDSAGVLVKTENYIYPEKKQPYWVESEYYDNGKPKSEKQFYYDVTGVSDTIKPKGIWRYYNKQGNITKIEKY